MGGIISAFGALEAGRQQQAIYNEQARQGRVSAQLERDIAARNAATIEEQRKQAVKTTERENIRHLGSAEAMIGVTGAQSTGSLIDVLSDLTLQASLREKKVDVAGRTRIQDVLFAGEINAFNLINRANLSIARGRAARSQAQFQALASFAGEFTGDGIFADDD